MPYHSYAYLQFGRPGQVIQTEVKQLTYMQHSVYTSVAWIFSCTCKLPP